MNATLQLYGIQDPAALVRNFVAAGRIKLPPPETPEQEAKRQRREYMRKYRSENPERTKATTLKAVRKFRGK